MCDRNWEVGAKNVWEVGSWPQNRWEVGLVGDGRVRPLLHPSSVLPVEPYIPLFVLLKYCPF